MSDTTQATDTKRQELIERMARAEVDRWDMDTLIDYAVEKIFANMLEADDGELATAWMEIIGDEDFPENPFIEAESIN